MLRINPFTSAAHMKQYLLKGLRGEYYSHDAEREALWQGKAAERLGLAGQQVTDEVFANLADNLLPDGSDRLTERRQADRIAGWDFTFSVPKNVSLLHATAKDERILDAVHAAVGETMREIEQGVMTRVRRNKQNHDQITGNLLWGEFVHTTARPVDGVPDPHLHVHAVVLNCTWDKDGQRFTAAKIRQIKENAPYYQAAFNSRVASRLNELGYATERSGKHWDIAGMPETTREKFSRRTAEIEKLAAELQIHDPAEKAKLGARTRKNKRAKIDRDKLESLWAERLTPAERDAITRVAAGEGRSRDKSVTEQDCLDQSIAHWFVRDSVISVDRLLERALQLGLGRFTPEQMNAASLQHPSLLFVTEDLERLCTTRKVLAEEKAMIRAARRGRGLYPALQGQQIWENPKGRHNADQLAAMAHVMTSQDRVMLIRGGAGTGKTTLLKTLVAGIEQRGHGVVMVAPGVDASRGQLRKEGFHKADTVYQLLNNPTLQAECRNGVMVCDEAGQLGTEDMNKLIRLAERQNARLLLVGDAHQHTAVARGDALRILQRRAGLKMAEVLTVHRQTGTYKQAVEAISKGKFDKGFRLLDELGAIHEITDAGRSADVALAYLATLRAGKSCLVVSPTHADGEQITELIRAGLKRDGRLSQEERATKRHRDLGWTVPEKQDPAMYGPGQIIHFRGRLPGFHSGQAYRVLGRNQHGHIEIQSARSCRRKVLPLANANNFDVFEEKLLRLAVGDKLRVTRYGKTRDGQHRLNNRSLYTLKGFTPRGDLVLDNDWVVSRNFAHWTHAYATTSHAAQGSSAQCVILSQPWSTIGAGNAKQFYVSVSRGRKQVMIFTDDREALIESVSKLGNRRSAVELVSGAKQKLQSEFLRHTQTLQRLRRYEQIRRQRIQRRQRSLSNPLGITRGR